VPYLGKEQTKPMREGSTRWLKSMAFAIAARFGWNPSRP
jgi:hypothetical protein